MNPLPDTALPPEIAAWIGRQSRRTDTISLRMAEAFEAMLTPHLAACPGAPLGIHWCLAPDIVGPGDLGPDGHPRTGLFLPEMPFSRRMWAGGELVYRGCFAVGDTVTKTSTICDVVVKTGKTGRLAFLTVTHAYHVADTLILSERQDIVYRDAAGSGSRPARPPESAASLPAGPHWDVTTDPTLLFRFSALTFNGHRIHYDHPYATAVEGYDGLVVHGPLQATLLIHLAAAAMGAPPHRFAYRGLAPLICGTGLRVEARRAAAEELSLRALDTGGTVTMAASAVP